MRQWSFHITTIIVALSAMLACECSDDSRRMRKDDPTLSWERTNYERTLARKDFSRAAQLLFEDAKDAPAHRIYPNHESFAQAAGQLISTWASSHRPPKSAEDHLSVARLARHAYLHPVITATHVQQAFKRCLQDTSDEPMEQLACSGLDDFVHELPGAISTREHDAIVVECWIGMHRFTTSCRDRHTLTTTLAQTVYNVAFLRKQYERAIAIAQQGKLGRDAVTTARLSEFRNAVENGDAQRAIDIWRDSGDAIPLAVRRGAYNVAKQQGLLGIALELASLAEAPRGDMQQLVKRLFKAHLEQHDPYAALRVAMKYPGSISPTDLNRATDSIWNRGGGTNTFTICRPLENGTMMCTR